ncbi:hypothetical protein N0B51_00070 [Tsuneonella sp. YG55]|uniref:Uncharacterized protein n=1 Tax=Tsuneonella litorea TaxID=2976475 RepID=A0A9X3A6J2_9SPHN|nr:hypothetical protein [Tsuneonella litorea]MCT2557371.1 hypothetical protein [Tsuneonella litorea]
MTIFPNVQVATRFACKIARADPLQVTTGLYQSDNEDLQAILPPKPEVNGQPRYYNGLEVGLLAIVTDFTAAGVKLPLSAKIARRVMEAHLSRPEVPQWVIVATDNGNVSTLPYSQVDLLNGFISGARLNFALVVDLASYAARVSAAVADAPKVIGGGDAV